MKRYTIIMPYLERADQFANTLLSYAHHYGDRDDYEVYVVVDSKNLAVPTEQEKLNAILKEFREQVLFKVPVVINAPKDYDPCRHFNLGAKTSLSEYIVLTTPEIWHQSNVLSGFDKVHEDNPNAYIVCACANGFKKGGGPGDYPIPRVSKFEDFHYSAQSFNPWRQHSQHNNRALHWCSCIRRQDYERIGGFDERYSQLIGWSDQDLVKKIRKAGIKIMQRDDLLVVHQWHKTMYPGLDQKKKDALFYAARDLFKKDYPGENV